jgi:seryl-tRNA synthetase
MLCLGGLLAIQQRDLTRLRNENAELRSQIAQITSLQERNETLTQQVKSATAAAGANESELLRLRGQASKLQALQRENTQLKLKSQQLAAQLQQSQAAAVPTGQGQVTAVSETAKANARSAREGATDLGPLDLQSGIPVHFDLGGGTNCTVTPTALSDGNNMMDIKVGVTNSDGSFSDLGTSRLTARPGQHCSISVGDRMIALAVTLKP